MDTSKDIRRELHTTASGLHLREDGGESGRTIEGYAILFDTPSAPLYADEEEEIREVIAKEAVTMDLLNSSDIKFTMFHDRQLLLARSKQGEGTLSYEIDDKGVRFSFGAPRTADGDKAVELVRGGIIDGCSFAFSTHYYDSAFVERTVKTKDGKAFITCRVKVITGIYDMTLTPDPAYPDTVCNARDLTKGIPELKREPAKDLRGYWKEMRDKAGGIRL